MERVVVTQSRLVLYGLTASGLVMAGLIALESRGAAPVRRVLGTLFFALPSLFAMWKLSRPLRPWVVLDADGIAVSFLGMKVIPWADILGARAFTRHGQGYVEISVRNGERYLRPVDRGALLLPMRPTSHRAADVAALVEQFRAHERLQSSAHAT